MQFDEMTDEELIALEKKLSSEILEYNNTQTAIKLCLNSLYGSLGTKYFRFFDVRMAEGITLAGQLCNRWVMDNINAYINKILNLNEDYIKFSDTDSCGICFDKMVQKALPDSDSDIQKVKFLTKLTTTKIQPQVDSFTDELSGYVNANPGIIKYKLEKICSSGVFVAKKRYALNVYSNEGVVYSEPKVKVTGLEIVKSSTPKIVRHALKDCVKLVLDGEQTKFQEYVKSFKDVFCKLSIEDIAFPRGVNGLDKYHDSVSLYKKGTPINSRGSILFNKLLVDRGLDSTYELIKDGDKIKFCYLKLPNPLKEDVIAFPGKLPKELDLAQYVDYNKMFDKEFLAPLKLITEAIKWDIEKRHRIEDFFT